MLTFYRVKFSRPTLNGSKLKRNVNRQDFDVYSYNFDSSDACVSYLYRCLYHVEIVWQLKTKDPFYWLTKYRLFGCKCTASTMQVLLIELTKQKKNWNKIFKSKKFRKHFRKINIYEDKLGNYTVIIYSIHDQFLPSIWRRNKFFFNKALIFLPCSFHFFSFKKYLF